MNILHSYRMNQENSYREIIFAESKYENQMNISIMADASFASLTLNRERWEELVAALRDFKWIEAPKAGTEPSPKTEAGPLSLPPEPLPRPVTAATKGVLPCTRAPPRCRIPCTP